MFVVLCILVIPFAILWETMKMNEKSHHRGGRRRRR